MKKGGRGEIKSSKVKYNDHPSQHVHVYFPIIVYLTLLRELSLQFP